ncbi:hypothetical protein HQ535_01215 [bacterium]|nr:hypothetical protein [bacterium]
MVRRVWIVLLLIGVVLALAVPAGAGKPTCEPGSTHPSCKSDEPDDGPVGLTCAEAEASGFDNVPVEWSADGKWFTFEMNLRTGACVDVMSVEGQWVVDVDVGSARGVSVGIQDSVAPGDACWGGCSGGVEAIFTETGTVVTPVIPAATIDACGVGFSDGADTLTFSASYSGVRKLASPVTVTVTLP